MSGAHGHTAVFLPIRAAERAGCPVPECEAKLFGGGRMFGVGRAAAGEVRDHDVAMARELAARHGLRMLAEDLGGEGRRQPRLDMRDGDVWMCFTPRGAPRARGSGR